MANVKRKKAEVLPKSDGTGEERIVKLWRRRIELAEEIRKKKAGDAPKSGLWADLIAFYEGSQWGKSPKDSEGRFHRITANKAKNNIDAIRPQLYFRNPKVKITIENPSLAPQDIYEPDPRDPSGQTPLMEPVMDPNGQPMMQVVPDPMTGQPTQQPMMKPKIRVPRGTPVANVGGQMVNADEQVELIEAISNYWMNRLDLKKVTKRNINDALILPFGVSKIYWVNELDKVMQADGNEVEQLVDQYPVLERVKPWCFYWDNELDEFKLEDANWVFEKKWPSKQDLEEDAMLRITTEDWADIGDPENYIDETSTANLSYEIDSDRKQDMGRYKMYEIHDLHGGEMMVWIEGMKRFARHDKPSAYAEVPGSIYTVLGFDETPDEAMPLPILQQIRSLNEAYNHMISYQVNHAGRLNRKYIIQEGAMKQTELAKWEDGADLTTVKVKAMNMGPMPVVDAPAPSDSYNASAVLAKEMSEGIGVTAYARQSREPGVDTATEASYLQSGMDVKVEEKRDTVKDYVEAIVKKHNILQKIYATKEQVTKVVGPKGQRWASWTRDDIQGEFLEEVDIYSSMPYSELEEKKQAMEMFSLAQADPYFDPIKLRQKVVQGMKWDEDVLYTEAEFQEIQMQQQQAAAAQQQQIEAQKQSSRTLRPTEGEVQRRSDMRAEMVGGPRR